jgi:hypothetical protein
VAEYPGDELNVDVPAEPEPYEDPVVAEPPPPPPVEPPPPPPPPPPPVEEPPPPPPPVEQAPPPPPPPVEEPPPPPPPVEQAPPDEGPPSPPEPPPVDEPAGADQSPVAPGQPGFEEEGDQSPVAPGQPGFEGEAAEEAPSTEQSPFPTGQPGFEGEGAEEIGVAEETGAVEQSPVRPGQPGFEGGILDELAAEGEPTEGDLAGEQTPFPEGQPGFDGQLEDAGFVFAPTDMSCWCSTGLPEDWTEWTPPTTPAPDSWTEEGYSTDWGVVEPEWAVGGEDPLRVTEPDRPISGVFGPGHTLDVHWADQGDTNYCGLYSVRTILSELGRPVDMDEMVSRAAANGWFVYDEATGEVKGIRPRDIDDILASYGVGSHQFGGPEAAQVADREAWQALNTALANNQRVVVGVDGREFDQRGDVGTAGTIDMDHFVAVSSVDYARGVVIVNDSARSAGLEIPLDVFFNSWRDSNFSLTITDTSMPGDGTAQPPAETGPIPEGPGISIIGTTLRPEPGEPSEPAEPGELSQDGDGTIVTGPAEPPQVPEAQQLGIETQPGESAPEPQGVTAEQVAGEPDARIAEQPGDGLERPTAALLGDLSPGFADADLTKPDGDKLDRGMADGLLDSILPDGVTEGLTPDDGVFDAILDLLGSIDDAIVDLAKHVMSGLTHPGGIRP